MADCDVVIPDPGASRHHAEIRRTEEGFVLSDLGSTNGTMVNEATVSERLLEEGDRITIGRTVLEFREG
jgi:pSer/pThr/pTyr-binding forkhead associated (FHA) protein